MAALIPGKARAEYGEHRQFCPVCASVPVTSVVHMSVGQQGLRYLHCNLCESEWYVVRSKCSNCEQTGDLHYWSLDSEKAAVKAESCGDCGTYLKMLYQEKDPAVEPVADDLASLVLDARMEQEGFARSSLNPFMFPGD
jgi:FdhE protein